MYACIKPSTLRFVHVINDKVDILILVDVEVEDVSAGGFSRVDVCAGSICANAREAQRRLS